MKIIYLIPISTFKAQFGTDTLGMIVVKPDQPERMGLVLEEVHKILGVKYGFDPKDERVFSIWDTVDTFREMSNTLIGIQLFLGIIGALTLIVGGCGHCQYHVRSGQGTHQRDRCKNGPRGPQGLGNRPYRT